MNTGPPRWETTQKMRSPSYPSPAELDAYAKKVAHSPLTIQIFPNSVKVPQRKHLRRTVNGLDTSSQRHSPYSSQLSASAGLLAVLRAPLKAPPALRPRGPHRTTMNLHSGSYGPQGSHLQSSSGQNPLSHLQHPQPHPPLPHSGPHPPSLQHKPLPHPGLLQRQQSLSQPPQRPPFPPGLQRQQSAPLPQQCGPPAPHGPLLHTLRHHEAPALHPGPPLPPHSGARTTLGLQTQELHLLPQPQTSRLQPGPPRASQGPPRAPPPGPAPTAAPLRPHLSDSSGPGYPGPPGAPARPPRAPQPGAPVHQQGPPQPGPSGAPPGQQGPPRAPLPDAPAAPFLGDSAPPPLAAFGPRKLPDADAPPNVTVSTSTIPLSMAGSLQRGPGDLSSIVLQINQLCQARAGLGGTSVCEGQIANPSPISRNLLINASSRVAHPAPQGFQLMPGADKGQGLLPGHPSGLPPGHPSGLPPGHPSGLPPGHPSGLPPGLPLPSQPGLAPNGLQSLQSFHSEEKAQSLQRSWAQHQLSHLQQPPEGAHPCKAPRLEAPDCSFAQNLSFSHKGSAQAFPLKHQEKSRGSPPVCSGSSLPYMDPQYGQHSWGPPQEMPVFQGPRGPAERFPGQKYKPGGAKDDPGVDFLPGNFQMSRFGDQSLEIRGPRQDPSPGGPLHGHHPGYR